MISDELLIEVLKHERARTRAFVAFVLGGLSGAVATLVACALWGWLS